MTNQYGVSYVEPMPHHLGQAYSIQMNSVAQRLGFSASPSVAEAMRDNLSEHYNKPNAYNVFTAATPFSSTFPVHYDDHQQLTGIACTQFDEKTRICNVSHLYTIKSEHYSGAALLENIIKEAQNKKAEAIRLWAENEKAAEWYVKQGFASYMKDANGKDDQRHLELKAEFFEEAIQKCRDTAKQPYKRTKPAMISFALPADFSV